MPTGNYPSNTWRSPGGVIGWVLFVGLIVGLPFAVASPAPAAVTPVALMLPFVFVFFVRTFPAGLLVYWITTNVWTIGQQLFVRKSLGQPMPWVVRREAAVAKAEGRPPPSPFASRKENGADPAVPAVPMASPPPPPRRKKKKTGKRR